MKRGLLLLLIGLLLLPVPALGAQESPDAAPSPSAAAIAAPAFSTPEPAAETPQTLTEDAEEARVMSLSAAEVAERMRQAGADADVTGNGAVDEADAIAMLLHVTGRLPDLAALPDILSDSLLGEKHLERFSYTGVQQGEGFYRSASVSYALTAVKEKDLNYYVADIYLRDLNHFRTAFGLDTYKRTEPVVDMAKNNQAIVAINGDYYSWKDNKGLVIRNGIVYRESIDRRQDLCVLYSDGVIETYAPDEADIEQIISRGAYQSWSFGPSLLDENGQPKTDRSQFRSSIQGPNPRSALGYIEPGHYLFVTVDGRGRGGSDGATMRQLSQLMYDHGCTIAYNLDGGGTAVMANAEGAISRQSNLSRQCSDILFIVEDYTVYDDEASGAAED